ncbi:hypothetical protein [Reyranella soli]|uniref:Gfo/Idh/MocA-like oxidoreductase C-terminal domain-containing protein n=1 Tax=Reyranella soli TaxID=1230389 RepID=A0A512NRT0_9HYPH|nr:hypothetical protein [Reyranella soli]GEP61655.1 hypothetical protein RSO01_88210 [Reyranella soli]
MDASLAGGLKQKPDHAIAKFAQTRSIGGSNALGTYYLAMQGPRRSERRITLIGDAARLDGVFEDGRFTIGYTDPDRDPIVWSIKGRELSGHGNGDVCSVMSFFNACVGRTTPPIKRVEDALSGLVFAASAEQSRTSHQMVTLQDDDFHLQ